MAQIESFLSARAFLSPQLVDERIYFISNLSGQMSLYAMDFGGSVPEPLLPPGIALQNPHLIGGKSFFVFPKIGKILVMLDKDGDENYQPTMISLTGGYPEPVLQQNFENYRVHLHGCDLKRQTCYFSVESRTAPMNETFQWDLKTGKLVKIAESRWGAYVSTHNKDHSKLIVIDGYTAGDNVLYLWEKNSNQRQLIYGTPLEARKPDQVIPFNAIDAVQFVDHDRGLLVLSAIFEDTFGFGYLRLKHPEEVKPVKVKGVKHHGNGELNRCEFIRKNIYLVEYNIDGCSWLYEGRIRRREVNYAAWKCPGR